MKQIRSPTIHTLGLSLAQAKSVLGRLQADIVTKQIQLLSACQRTCKHCGLVRKLKDYHEVHYRSLFGDIVARVPRWRACSCNAGGACAEIRKRQRWISAELEFVQSQLAATIPYAKSAELLCLLLPVSKGNAVSTVREHALAVGRRLDEQGLVVEAAASQTDSISATDASITTIVGLDSGYVRHCHPDPEQSFEVVAGRAMQEGYGQRSLAFVQIIDDHSKERVRVMLSHFGGAEQALEVFTDGDTRLRQWQQTTLPGSSHVLDWYHLKTRIAKLNSVVHSRLAGDQLKPYDHDRLSGLAGGLKWRLWHGRSGEARTGSSPY
ncbi:hypothetical protein LP417_24110 [Polaromonas sp. P1-6]|nr:hypothetical protein LP417_24110 [Polaromonas sp. P1-6]